MRLTATLDRTAVTQFQACYHLLCGEHHKSHPFTLLTNMNAFNEVLLMVAAYSWENNLTPL